MMTRTMTLVNMMTRTLILMTMMTRTPLSAVCKQSFHTETSSRGGFSCSGLDNLQLQDYSAGDENYENILSEYSRQISSGRGSGIQLVQHHRTFSGSPREDEFEVIYLLSFHFICVGLGGGIKLAGVDGINEIVSPAWVATFDNLPKAEHNSAGWEKFQIFKTWFEQMIKYLRLDSSKW